MNISELPREYQDLIPPREKRRDPHSDDINYALVWDTIFPGHNFWYQCYKATSIDNLPPIPPKKEDGFNIIRIGNECKAEIIKDGLQWRFYFYRGNMTNCGMTLFKSFSFPSKSPEEKYKKDIIKFYTQACGKYPFALATHTSKYKDWFFCWEQIDEFLNPNSKNYVQIWKFTNKNL